MMNSENAANMNPLPGPYLLVPIAVDALMVNRFGNSVDYADITPAFENLEVTVLGADLRKQIFAKSPHPKPGVHLHWSLPDALTHGCQDESSGAVEYPCVPNRWFVIRIHTDSSNPLSPSMALKSWIIESDYRSAQRTPFNQESATVPTLEAEDQSYRYLGQRGVYGVDALPAEDYLDKLTAIGPGDPMFAAYYPNCRNVFGLHDDLQDLEQGLLTYFVAGWYANPGQDPLFKSTVPEVWQDSLNQFSWSVPKETTINPTRTLCHGMVFNLCWDGPDGQYSAGIPPGQPDMAVGNTSIEALSALIASKLPQEVNIERLMQGFMYDLISKWDAPDGLIELEETIHQKGFTAKNGGNPWLIRRNPDAPQDNQPHSEVQPFPENIGELLSRLNKKQTECEKLQRQASSLQWELYSAWYKSMMLQLDSVREDSGPVAPADIEPAIHRLISELKSLNIQLACQNETLTQIRSLLETEVKRLMPGYELKQEAGQRFWQAKDPVVLFAGPGVDRSFNHGADGRFTSDGTLFCRVSGQTLGGITLTPASREVTVSAADIQVFIKTPIPPGPPLPADIWPLFTETLLLDISQAIPIALAAFKKAGIAAPAPDQVKAFAGRVKKAQTMPWNAVLYPDTDLDPQALSVSAGLLGTLPSKLGINPWQMPWIPLFMEWSLFLNPDKNLLHPEHPFQNWNLGEVDYRWNTAAGSPETMVKEYKGFIILTPHASINLQDVMLKYIRNLAQDDPQYAKLRNLAGRLGNLNILSQALSGFNEDLIQRRQTLQLPVFGDPLADQVAELIGDMNHLSPLIYPDFNPIRGGFAKINNLWIVDAFGQIQKFTSDPWVVLSETVSTPGDLFENLITLPPRITQPSRLIFKWLSADDDRVETNSDPGTSPICGFILPNHLNQSLMIYDASGNQLGSLQTLKKASGQTTAVWWGPPGTSYQPGAPPPNMNPQLKGFVDQLLAYEKEGASALEQLVAHIDETLWTVNPLGAKENKSLSALVGRPLALARAYLKLELEGDPAYKQGWDAIGKNDSGGLENVPFPVRIGDFGQIGDGLIGFFADRGEQTYRIFHPTHSVPNKSGAPAYIDANDQIQLTCAENDFGALLTLLIDPRAGVHLTSGILPVKYAELPKALVAEALKNISVSFLVSPLLINSLSPSIPLPVGVNGAWSWIYPEDSVSWRKETAETKANSIIPSQQQIHEGWLQLMNAMPGNSNQNQDESLKIKE